MRVGLMATPRAAPDFPSKGAEYLFQESGGNTGNFAFVHALNQHLGSEAVKIPWWYSAERLRDNCDLIVIACANQLGKHTDLGGIATNLDEAKLPIIAVGLGAQSSVGLADIELSAGTRRWLDVIAAHPPSKSPNIGVRGEFTRQQVAKLGHPDRGEIIGCPSNFINLDPLLGHKTARREIIGNERVAVPAGHHLWFNLRDIERVLAEKVDSLNGIYVAQSEIDMLRLAAQDFDSIDPNTLDLIREYVRPHLDLPAFKSWVAGHMVAFNDASSWMDRMKEFSFVVGARFHGVMLAMQAGVLGGVVAHDSRTVELCDTTRIPYVRAADLSIEMLATAPQNCFPFDGADYDKRRRELAAKYSSLLQGGGLETSFLAPFMTT